MTTLEFPFRFHPAFRAPAAVFGVRPHTAWVVVEGDVLIARFGPWRVQSPLDNVTSACVTGPYAWPKVIGPAHVSLRDRGMTFATTPESGVCIRFERPVRGIDALGLVRHPALTVTVEDGAALAELLDRSSHQAQRAHTAAAPTVEELAEEAAVELHAQTAAELRRRARERGVTGTSRMSKAELVEALSPTANGA